ncbi:MAG: hypothetical protein K2I16_04950 [Muribaculaceae bacterium]|nr:hypothetical protein [Muribaculaceae bacterium]
MMDIKKILLTGALIGGVSAHAQAPQSFQEFRQGILNDFQEFRKTILDHYADFLNGTWHEYEPLEPLKKPSAPKPMDVPDVKINKPSTAPVDLPKPVLADLPESKVKPEEADEPEEKPKSPFDIPKTITPPEAGKEVPPTFKVRPDLGGAPALAALPDIPRKVMPQEETPVDEPEEIPAPKPEESRAGKDPVNFYGMEILVPQVNFKIMQSMGSAADFARNWKLLDEQDVADAALDALKPKMEHMGLNDYLAYEFLCAYMDSKFPGASSAPKMSAVHYLLSHMGYNARIALSTKTGDAVLLIPSQQTLYGKVYMTLGGERFYVMAPPGVNIMGSPIATCDLPKVASKGKKFDLRIKGLNLPMKEHRFDVEYGKLRLSGVVNENLMPIVYRYPQMDTADFAESELDSNLRKDLVNQVREQLGGMDLLAATNELLQFVQSGFSYATDDAFHGFEKPYFLEENLYYPKNDCEDRAIFYTYMLWNALEVENHLLFYPGHESASVSLPDQVTGTSYEHNGKKFYISDPTYVGSITGQCMPQFESTVPKIDLTLPK